MPAPFSSKAPTPEFGEGHYNCFEELLGYNSEEDNKKERHSSSGRVKPESSAKNEQEWEGNPEAVHEKDANFSKKNHVNEVNTPGAANRNITGSAFYLHEFDFYHKTSQQND